MMNEIKLYEREYKILNKILNDFKSLQELSSELNIPFATLYSWVEDLKIKGYVDARDEILKKISLTEEGKRYAEQGLPEKRLALILKEKEAMSLEELKSFFTKNELDIAIMHALKKGFIKYFEGKIKFVSLYETNDEKLLNEIKNKGEIIVNELNEELKILKRRGLIEVNEFKKTYIKASKFVRDSIISKNYVIIPEISKITSDDIISGKWKQYPLKAYNLEALPPIVYFGRSQVYMRFLEEVKKVLLEMGFEEYDWDYILPELWNFDVLFVPQDHPARDVQDTFRVNLPPAILDEIFAEKVKDMHEKVFNEALGWNYKWDAEIARRLVLRTHTTPVSIRYIYENKDKEAKVFCISRNFRRDLPDRTHFIEFYQCEGIMVGNKLNFSNLLYFLKEFASRLGLEKIRFKPSYFPFTEPSVEGSVYHDKLGWIEALPGGMFRPEMLNMLGVKSRVLAWGIGIDRLAMAYLGIDDIRELFSKDLNFLRSARML
jgi:phenylalanyl-tRNA synthetase alpha chain